MNIAIINTTANKKSTGKIAYGMYKKLCENGNNAFLYYGRGSFEKNDDHVIRITGKTGVLFHGLLARITGLNGYFSTFQTFRLIHLLKKQKPDLVQLYNLHGYFININLLISFLKKRHIPTVYSMLDEFPYLGRCCYSFNCNLFMNGCLTCKFPKKEYPATWIFRNSRKFIRDKKKIYDAFDNLCFVAPEWVVQRAQKSYLLGNKKLFVVDEYVDTDHLFFPRKKYQYVNSLLLQSEKKIVLTVAPYSDARKGGVFFLNLARKLSQNSDYLFVYIGMNVSNVSIPDNCIPIGYINDQNELAEYYSIADVFVCTSLADTMPNVCLDALSSGTPIIGFNNTGIPYTAEKPFGVFVENKNVNDLCDAVLNVKKKDDELILGCREYALTRYSPEVYYNKMVTIYNTMKTL